MKLTVPFYLNKAGAGFPSPATDYIEEDIDLNIHLIKNVPATFVIRVQGKSMTDVGIYDGDLLVVDKSLKPKNFSTVVANVHDELVVKNFVKTPGSHTVEVLQVQLEVCLEGDGHQVEDCVGRSPEGHDHGYGVLERTPGHDLARTDALAEQAHHGMAAGEGDVRPTDIDGCRRC